MAENNVTQKKAATRNDARREIAGQTFDAAAIGMMAAGIGLSIIERDAVAAGRETAPRSSAAQPNDVADTPAANPEPSSVLHSDVLQAQGFERADAPQPVAASNFTAVEDRAFNDIASVGDRGSDRADAGNEIGGTSNDALSTPAAMPVAGSGAPPDIAGGSAESLIQNSLQEMTGHISDIASSITSGLTAATSYLNTSIDSIVDRVLGGSDGGLGSMLASTVEQITAGPTHLLDQVGTVGNRDGDLLSSDSPLASLPPALLGATSSLAPDPVLNGAFGAPADFASGVVNTISLADFDSGAPISLGFLGQTYADNPDLGGHGVGTMLHGLV